MVRSVDRAGLKLPGWDGRYHNPIPGRQCRPRRSRHSAMGNWFPVRAPDRAFPTGTMAAAQRLACFAVLGICFFGLFFVLYDIAVTLRPGPRKSRAVDIATSDHGYWCPAWHSTADYTEVRPASASRSLVSSLRSPPASRLLHPERREGELIMTGRGGCAWRSTTSGLVRSSGDQVLLASSRWAWELALTALIGRIADRFVAVLSGFSAPRWIAGIYLGVGGGALAFILWVLALERATPTRVANTMTVNPIAAGLLATQLVGEPITLDLIIGLVAVFAGIWIATTEAKIVTNVSR